MNQKDCESKLIIGLGNPGDKYKNTRHNIGFEIIDKLSEKYKVSLKKESKFLSHCGITDCNIENKKVKLILGKPLTYMNSSGEAVEKLLNWFKLQGENLIVIHDEVALDLGKIRISSNRGAGGHHGIESIIEKCGGNFTRLRIGVGPDPGGDDRADFVLSKFTKDEKEIFNKVINISIEALDMLLEKNIEEVMNKYNGMEILN